jgi:hypothetical protein
VRHDVDRTVSGLKSSLNRLNRISTVPAWQNFAVLSRSSMKLSIVTRPLRTNCDELLGQNALRLRAGVHAISKCMHGRSNPLKRDETVVFRLYRKTIEFLRSASWDYTAATIRHWPSRFLSVDNSDSVPRSDRWRRIASDRLPPARAAVVLTRKSKSARQARIT